MQSSLFVDRHTQRHTRTHAQSRLSIRGNTALPSVTLSVNVPTHSHGVPKEMTAFDSRQLIRLQTKDSLVCLMELK